MWAFVINLPMTMLNYLSMDTYILGHSIFNLRSSEKKKERLIAGQLYFHTVSRANHLLVMVIPV